MEKIHVAILGLGQMGAPHVKAAQGAPYVEKIYGYEPEPQRLQRWGFGDGEQSMQSHIVETLTYSVQEGSQWMHNTHGQNLRIAELVAKGLPPEVSARDAYETMRLCFAVEQSEEEGRIVILGEGGV